MYVSKLVHGVCNKMSTMTNNLMVLHRDLQEYYAEMGFMETSTTADLLAKVVLPSQKRPLPPESPEFAAGAGTDSSGETDHAETYQE